jgi:FkbM family methyltransferase
VYIGRNRVLTLTPWGVKMITSADDLSLMPDVALTGEYDAPFLRFLERTIRPGDAVVDVGANVGLFALRMAWLTGPSGSVIAFEPNPDVRRLLVDNVALNYAAPWVEISPLAAGGSAGTATLHVTARFQGNSSLVAKDAAYHRHFLVDEVETVEVVVAPLDEVLAPQSVYRLVKIDVEGGEPDVLDGMRRLLADGRVELVDVEVSDVASAGGRRLLRQLEAFVADSATLWELAADGTPQPISPDAIEQRGRLPHVVVDLAGSLGST